MPNRSTEQTRIKRVGRIGPGRSSTGKVLKRVVHWSGNGFNWEADPRLMEKLINMLNLSGTSTLCKTPSSTSILTNRFHVTHYGGFAVLFNKDTFFSDIKVSSICLHDTTACEIKEAESGWVLQGVVSRAAFRRQPRSGQKLFTVMSLHINNNYAKKRGRSFFSQFALLCRMSRWSWWPPVTSTKLPGANHMAEAFVDTDLPMSPCSTPLWGPGAVPGEWTDVCGFVKLPNSCDKWKVRLRGAFKIHPRDPGPPSKRSKLPPRSVATPRPCRQSICS